MKGLSPVFAIIATLIFCFFTVLLITGGHPFWGVIFAIFTVDCFADVVLCLKRQ